jgi:hypothetical protein
MADARHVVALALVFENHRFQWQTLTNGKERGSIENEL